MKSFIMLLCVTAPVFAANYNVKDFGAIGDGTTENAAAIQKAIDTAAAHGGGIVQVPAGVYRTLTIFLKSHVTLRIDSGATLMGSPNLTGYSQVDPAYQSFMARSDKYPQRVMIVAINEQDVAITGCGTINGNGNDPNLNVARLNSVNLVRFIKCHNVRMLGDGSGSMLKVVNSSHWTVQPMYCDTVHLQFVHIENYGGTTPDGLPISDCSNVLVEDCYVGADDDAITLKSGSPNITMRNFEIRNTIALSRVCGFKVGPQTWGPILDVNLTGCTFGGAKKPPATQFKKYQGIFLNIGNHGYIDGVTIDSCTVKDEPSAIGIFLGRLTDANWTDYWPGAGTPTGYGYIKNIIFRNLSTSKMGNWGILIEGRDVSRIQNVTFDKVQLELPGGGTNLAIPAESPNKYPNMGDVYPQMPAYAFFLRHVDGIKFRDTYAWNLASDIRPALVTEDVLNMDTTGFHERKP